MPESLAVVGAILSFLYKKCYSDPSTRPLEFHAQVYVAAVKYNVVPLSYYATYGKIQSWLGSFEQAINSADSSPHSPALQQDMLEFLEAVALVYTNTHEVSDILRREITDTARKILRTHSTVLDDAWTKCFSESPQFVLDLVKPEKDSNYSLLTFDSWAWRTASDCIWRECNACDTAVVMSKQAWVSGGRDVDFNTKCPNYDYCDGRLEYEVPDER